MSLPPLYLTVLVFLPAVAAGIVALMPRNAAGAVRAFAVVFGGLHLLLTVILFLAFDRENPAVQFVDRAPWVPQFGVDYYLGVDGLGVTLVLLTSLLFFLATLVALKVDFRVRDFFALVLVLETGVIGVFTALDLFLFFLFWEVELLPMYLLIALWGTGRKEYSAMKFLIYTFAGSAVMLVGILATYFIAFPEGERTFDMFRIAQSNIPASVQGILFLLLVTGFAFKLPVVPFHTWLPDAHVDAPTSISVLLAGILLKMGGYGFIRVGIQMMPEGAQQWAWLLAILAVIGVIYGAAVSMVQSDLKKLVAYSSVSSMGFALLGMSSLTQIGLSGATLQLFTHGLYSGMLFTLVGVLYDKAHTRQIAEFGGLVKRMPFTSGMFVLGGLAALGLPGLAPFVSEFLVFLGSFPSWEIITIVATCGIVVTAGYILWMQMRIFYGPLNTKWEHLGDATMVERVPLAIFTAMLVLFGVLPGILTGVIDGGIADIVARLRV